MAPTDRHSPGDSAACKRPRKEGLTKRTTDGIEAPARPQPSGVVRRPQVGELGEQIAVGPYLILGHLPIGEQS